MKKIISNILFGTFILVVVVIIILVSYRETRYLAVSGSDMDNVPLSTLSSQNEVVLSEKQAFGEKLDEDICSLSVVNCQLDTKSDVSINSEKDGYKVDDWYHGIASYYTEAENCSESECLTASGTTFHDTDMTVACLKEEFVLGTNILVCHNNVCVDVECNDRGGFKRLNRKLDLSPAVRDAIGCGGLCEVFYKAN